MTSPWLDAWRWQQIKDSRPQTDSTGRSDTGSSVCDQEPVSLRLVESGREMDAASMRTGLMLVASLLALPRFSDEDRVLCLAELRDVIEAMDKAAMLR